MPDILTSDHYDDFLSDDVQQRKDLQLLVNRAEIRVVDRYRNTRPLTESTLRFDAFDGDPGVVMLHGWEEDSNGNPDTTAMDAELVNRLRLVIATVVGRMHEHQEREGVESLSQGDRSVTYGDFTEVPTAAFQPLDKYDKRQPFTGYW